MNNCIEYKYYKNKIINKNLDSLETSFGDIKNMFNTENIQYKPIFIDDPLDITEYQRGILNMYFTYHKHVVEKKTDETEDLEYNNWYIIMYHDKIVFELPNNSNQEIKQEIGEEIKQEINQEIEQKQIEQKEIEQEEIGQEIGQEIAQEIKHEEIGEEIRQEIRHEIKQEYTLLKNNGGKITIKLLKDLLKKLNLKSSGKKEELQVRLENAIERKRRIYL